MDALKRNQLQKALGGGGGFTDALVRFSEKCEARTLAVHAGTVQEVYRSVVHGSELTSAPGQPVATGDLRDSWTIKHEGPLVSVISSNSPYARAIEHNWRRVGRVQLKAFRKKLRQASLAAGLAKPLRATKARVEVFRRSLGGLGFRNHGPHSVKLTKAGFKRIVEYVANQVAASG